MGPDFGRAFSGLGELVKALLWVCVISVPLGVWKLVEIVLWVASHVEIK
jgi:hypothetical protein